MTVSNQLKHTFAGLKDAQACLETYAMETQDKDAKELFTDCAEKTQHIIESLEPRIAKIEEEEPQYKGF